MPNPKDLQGLQLRQTLSPRQVLFYSPQYDYTCLIRQGSKLLPLRVNKKTLPTVQALDGQPQVVRVECTNEQQNRTNLFYIPAVDYVPPLVR